MSTISTWTAVTTHHTLALHDMIKVWTLCLPTIVVMARGQLPSDIFSHDTSRHGISRHDHLIEEPRTRNFLGTRTSDGDPVEASIYIHFFARRLCMVRKIKYYYFASSYSRRSQQPLKRKDIHWLSVHIDTPLLQEKSNGRTSCP